ncbi:hypothetical protein CEQ90_01270 [Lewinellaceae bacterium SD302]|nr:hypothetical protein CEQ90_01270 [Lewinellaceae bacterium SD302]
MFKIPYTGFLFLIFCLHLPFLVAQPDATATIDLKDHQGHTCSHEPTVDHRHQGLGFIQNKGQWHENISYAAELGGLNHLFLEDNAFTYVFYDTTGTREVHEYMQAAAEVRDNHLIAGHAYRVHFVGANSQELTPSGQRSAYNNYFLGQDPAKWASEVGVFEEVRYRQLYPGIELAAYSQDGHFKYDFIVTPGGNTEDIRLRYEGVDAVSLKDGNLKIETSVHPVTELAPYAYQMVNGIPSPIACQYVLVGNELTFSFPDGYNRSLPLIIDPTVIGATLSGTFTNANFGHSATYDNAGNIYTAGISFGTGYPTNTGSFQTNFAGGETDFAISKYNVDGSDLLYATYIGGDGSDYPHSTITDIDGNLVIFGSSDSDDFPTTAGAVQENFGGNTDIVISKLNASGSALIGSTYLGGSGIDGLNRANANTSLYGDIYRGEVILDAQSNVYIASGSSSINFPVTAGAYQTEIGQIASSGIGQDGVLCKFNPDLSELNWATFLGGDDPDFCSSLRIRDNGNVYVAGLASNANFPMVSGGQTELIPGGQQSAFLVEISADGSEMVNGTYWGTDEVDRAYFMDTDQEGQVHIFGITFGDMPITDDTYFFNEGSNQFLAAFNADLDELVYSTVIGSGSDFVDFVPVAFMVDRCNGIYFSGYYSGDDLPLTNDAIYTQDNSFYLGVLKPNAVGLSFGTYYGRANHVDGGTSRFDKAGIVYQAVCSCDGGNVMSTTPNAYATMQDTYCDVGVFKIDFEVDVVTASAFASPMTAGCAPYTVDFAYTGEDAEFITWHFGDGSDSSVLFDPSHTFQDPGTYTVTQIVEAPNSCNARDTFQLQIEVIGRPEGNLIDTSYCISDGGITLEAINNDNESLNWPDGSSEATFLAPEPGIYWVEVGDDLCPRQDTFFVSPTSTVDVDLGEDLQLCDLAEYQLDVSNVDAITYLWQDGSTDPAFLATEPGDYFVALNDNTGCEVRDTVSITFGETPTINLGADITTCETTVLLDATHDEVDYLWQDGSMEATYTVTESGSYSVTIANFGCQARDTIQVTLVEHPEALLEATGISCAGEVDGMIELTLTNNNGPANYVWSSGQSTPDLTALAPGEYTVTITDDSDCAFVSTVEIQDVDPISFSILTRDPVCDNGIISIPETSGGTPPYSYAINARPFGQDSSFNNLGDGSYIVSVTDTNGCLKRDTLMLIDQPGVLLDAGRDLSIRLGDSIRINANISSLQDQALVWSPPLSLSCVDCLRPFARPVENTNYLLTTTDTIIGCSRIDEVQILVDRTRRVYIPNAFSPNGDGVNDLFYVFSDAAVVEIKSFRVFNRWGSLLYEALNVPANDPRFGWDGTFNKKDLTGQVLVYTIEIEFLDGLTEIFKGDVTLLR